MLHQFPPVASRLSAGPCSLAVTAVHLSEQTHLLAFTDFLVDDGAVSGVMTEQRWSQAAFRSMIGRPVTRGPTGVASARFLSH